MPRTGSKHVLGATTRKLLLRITFVVLRLITAGTLACLAWSQALEQGKRAFDAGNYRGAEELFEKAHRESPSCDILLYLGLTHYRLKKMDSALIAFQEAVQCDSKLVAAHLALGEAYAQQGNDAEAVAAYRRALTLQPANRDALRGAALIYARDKLDEKAIEVLELLVQVDPSDTQAHTDLGAAYFATGNHDGAEAQFEQALHLKPDSAAALLGLGNVNLRKGQEEEAIAVLQKAARLSPKAFEPHFLLGSAYNRQGRYKEALTELQTALQLGGNEPEVYYHVARAYAGLGRQDDRRVALARFAELSKKAKQDAEAQRRARKLVEEAKSLVGSGDLKTALVRMEEARELRPSDDSLLFRLASLNFDLEHYSAARDYAQEAIALAPSAWLYHFLLGLIESRSGRLAAARSSLDLAVRLNPSAAEVHNALGEVALAEGDPQRALKAFGRAAELDSQKPEYRENLEAARKAASLKP